MITDMNLSLPSPIQKLIDDRVRSGKYGSAEDVVAAALTHLEQQEHLGSFGAGELDALIAEGEADIARGDVLELDRVFAELRRANDARPSSR
jgi:putative addiction module CopG family antidote